MAARRVELYRFSPFGTSISSCFCHGPEAPESVQEPDPGEQGEPTGQADSTQKSGPAVAGAHLPQAGARLNQAYASDELLDDHVRQSEIRPSFRGMAVRGLHRKASSRASPYD